MYDFSQDKTIRGLKCDRNQIVERYLEKLDGWPNKKSQAKG